MKKEFLTRLSVCLLSLFLSSVLVFVWTFLNFFLFFHHIEKFTFFNTHKREEKKRREERLHTFLIRLFTRTSSYTHRRHLKHIKERERLFVCRLSTTHTLSTLSLSLSLSLSSFEKKVWRTRRNVRRSWKPGERN